jgi:triosephosphate isomerase (TIM)
MRKPFISGNWKMHGDIAAAKQYIDEFNVPEEMLASRQIVVCPPATLLHFWKDYGKNKSYIEYGAQNVHWEAKGAFTGDISVGMLLDAGCKHCIIGHSERRAYYKESDEQVNKKMNALLDAGITPIVCCGETLEVREAGKKEAVVGGQVKGSIVASAARADISKIVIAYEPVWAIGTGVTATDAQAEEMCAFVRGIVAEGISKEAADSIRILYGGSVKPDNIDALMAKENIDGVLVGGASLKASDFSRIAAFKS